MGSHIHVAVSPHCPLVSRQCTYNGVGFHTCCSPPPHYPLLEENVVSALSGNQRRVGGQSNVCVAAVTDSWKSESVLWTGSNIPSVFLLIVGSKACFQLPGVLFPVCALSAYWAVMWYTDSRSSLVGGRLSLAGCLYSVVCAGRCAPCA